MSEASISSASEEQRTSQAEVVAGGLIPVQPGRAALPPSKERNASLWADARRDLIRNPSFVVSMIYILMVSSMAVAPWLWTRADPKLCLLGDSRLPVGSPGHWLGTNTIGCDYYAHAVYGSQPSLQIALMATTGIILIGLPLGTLAGFYGGWVDAIISRLVDIVFALPFLLGALVILALIKKYNIWTITLVLVLLGWTTITRLMRGSVLSVKSLDYVHAAKALGATNSRLMFTHILPNAIAPVFVVSSISLGAFVATEATLTFLGVGLQAPAVSWGIMITQNQSTIQEYPFLVIIPCTLLVGTVLSFILIGDALRDALDPKLR